MPRKNILEQPEYTLILALCSVLNEGKFTLKDLMPFCRGQKLQKYRPSKNLRFSEEEILRIKNYSKTYFNLSKKIHQLTKKGFISKSEYGLYQVSYDGILKYMIKEIIGFKEANFLKVMTQNVELHKLIMRQFESSSDYLSSNNSQNLKDFFKGFIFGCARVIMENQTKESFVLSLKKDKYLSAFMFLCVGFYWREHETPALRTSYQIFCDFLKVKTIYEPSL